MFNRIQVEYINPKSVTMGQLYGETDKATQEWKDGVLAVTFRFVLSVRLCLLACLLACLLSYFKLVSIACDQLWLPHEFDAL